MLSTKAHILQVVREELVKKLSEAKLIAENSTQAGRPNTTAKSLSSTESTVEGESPSDCHIIASHYGTI